MCSPSLPTPESVNFGTATRYTPRLHPMISLHTSKWVALADTPSTSWLCIKKCSATTSPSTITCSRTPNGKLDGQEEQYPTRPCSFFLALPSSQVTVFRAQMIIGKSARRETRHGPSGNPPTIGPTPRQESRHKPIMAVYNLEGQTLPPV